MSDLLTYSRLSSRRALRITDLALALWVIVWMLVGIAVFLEIRELKKLSETLVASSRVLEETGDVLGSFAELPLLGDGAERAERELRETAASALRSGRSSQSNIQVLSVLLGAATALVPTVPLVALYLPLRARSLHEVASVKSALQEFEDDPLFREFLARRAANRLGYHELREITPNPWRDIRDGRFESLSRAELSRLGVERKPSKRNKSGSGVRS